MTCNQESILSYILDHIHSMSQNDYRRCIDAKSRFSFAANDPTIHDVIHEIGNMMSATRTYDINGYENVYIMNFQYEHSYDDSSLVFEVDVSFDYNGMNNRPIVLDSMGAFDMGGARRSAIMQNYDLPVSSGIHPVFDFNYVPFRKKGEPIGLYKLKTEEHFDEELFEIKE